MEKIGVLGTGMVGQTIASKLISLGYDVMMGSRKADNEKAVKWTAANGKKASNGTFSDAAKFGSIIFLCTKGKVTLDILKLAGPGNFYGKTVIDVSNPLDFSKGMPPTLFVCNDNSLGELVQKSLPGAFVVKSLNIVNCEVMVDAKKSGGSPTMFMCGNDAGAKGKVKEILTQFNWDDVIDLGDISTARGTEMMLPIWLRTFMATGNGYIGFKIVRPNSSLAS
jgi:predicted dinucleotide-binding enzyme